MGNSVNIAAPKRNMGADVIRCLAFFSVVAVHFLGRIGFYNSIVEGKKMFVITLIRSFFIICVPLYMMLSGYLTSNKKPDWKYYSKIWKTYLTYVLCCLCCVAYSAFYLKNEWDMQRIILETLGFTAAPYAWYVEMYLGLFLLIPFFNILYHNIPDKKTKNVLIIVMVVLTALPSVVNVYDFEGVKWLEQPASPGYFDPVIPDWWKGIYPVTYYFIGCYLKEYGCKFKKLTNFLLIIVTLAAFGGYCFWRSHEDYFAIVDWSEYQSIFCVVLTTLVFAFFINLNYDKVPVFVSKLLKLISGLSFGAYLVSWIFDSFIYEKFNAEIPEMMDRMKYFPLITLIIFALSLILSFVVSKIQMILEWIIDKIGNIFSKKSSLGKSDK